MPSKKTALHPPPPAPPRSHLLPIAALTFAVFAAIAVPAAGSAMGDEAQDAEAAAPEEIRVKVTIRSEPEGAAVKVDGEERGMTPLDLELLAEEEVALVLEREGYAATERTLTPSLGMEPLDLTLEAERPSFVLRVQAPPGATVAVNGNAVEDPANVELGSTLEGSVRVSVRQRGFQAFVAEVDAAGFTLQDGKRVHTVTAELARRPPRPRFAVVRPAEVAPEPAAATSAAYLPDNPF